MAAQSETASLNYQNIQIRLNDDKIPSFSESPMLLRGLMKAEEHSTKLCDNLSQKVSLIDFLGMQYKDASNDELEYTLENGDNDKIRTHYINAPN